MFHILWLVHVVFFILGLEMDYVPPLQILSVDVHTRDWFTPVQINSTNDAITPGFTSKKPNRPQVKIPSDLSFLFLNIILLLLSFVSRGSPAVLLCNSAPDCSADRTLLHGFPSSFLIWKHQHADGHICQYTDMHTVLFVHVEIMWFCPLNVCVRQCSLFIESHV